MSWTLAFSDAGDIVAIENCEPCILGCTLREFSEDASVVRHRL